MRRVAIGVLGEARQDRLGDGGERDSESCQDGFYFDWVMVGLFFFWLYKAGRSTQRPLLPKSVQSVQSMDRKSR
jgi:hypothetical protein